MRKSDLYQLSQLLENVVEKAVASSLLKYHNEERLSDSMLAAENIGRLRDSERERILLQVDLDVLHRVIAESLLEIERTSTTSEEALRTLRFRLAPYMPQLGKVP